MPLTVIFQHSLSQGKFPMSWKCAKIVPLYKGQGDPSVAASYRPISTCSCFGKILERIVNEHLPRHLERCGLSHPVNMDFAVVDLPR